VDNRCHVRTLLRTVGVVASLAALSGSAYAEDVNGGAPANQAMRINEGPVAKDNGDVRFPGGPLEAEGAEFNRGVGSNPCALTVEVDSNTYDRPVGQAPYASLGVGPFNSDQIYRLDDFRVATAARLSTICWRGSYTDPICTPVSGTEVINPATSGTWIIKIYAAQGPLNVAPLNYPAGPVATFTSGVNMTVTRGRTGDPQGFTPGAPTNFEVGFSAVIDNPAAGPLLNANQCYFIEFYQEEGSITTCPAQMTASYENEQGNRRSYRRDNNLPTEQTYNNETLRNFDLAISLGFDTGALLADSNLDAGGALGTFCTNRTAPANDLIANAVVVSCGSTVTSVDNSLATLDSPGGVAAFSCRKDNPDPTDYVDADIWYRFSPGTFTSFSVSLCQTNPQINLAGGDSLMSVFRLTNTLLPADLSNLTQVGCADDSCTNGYSQVDVIGATNQQYYVRIGAYDPLDQGQYTLTVNCPIPVAANDFCNFDGAANPQFIIPRLPNSTYANGYSSSTGQTSLIANNRTASIDANIQPSCGVSNNSPGVWYRMVGGGNVVQVETIEVTADFNTTLTIYCGSCPTSGPIALSCLNTNDGLQRVAANDNIFGAQDILISRTRFCAALNQTYYILVQTAGGTTGDFRINVRELRDGTPASLPIPCCDFQICGDTCDFTSDTPVGSQEENGFIGAVNDSGSFIEVTEVCQVLFPYTTANPLISNTNFSNQGCSGNPPAGQERRFGSITEGNTRTGSAWRDSGAFDSDWFTFVAPNGGTGVGARMLVNTQFAAQGPIQLVPWTYDTNLNTCAVIRAFGSDLLTAANCNQIFDNWRHFDNVNGTAPNNVPSNVLISYRTRSTSTGNGYNCTTNTRYWFKVNDAINLSDCAALALPTVPFDDETGEFTADPNAIDSVTYMGALGDDGNASLEPCVNGDAAGNRRKAGCFSDAAADGSVPSGEFFALTIGRPIRGRIDASVGGDAAGVDLDWWLFDLTQRSLVTVEVRSPFVFAAQITENTCDLNVQKTFASASTRGSCVSNSLDDRDGIILEGNPSRYQLVVFSVDPISGGQIFNNTLCDHVTGTYEVIVRATPVTACPAPVCPAVLDGNDFTEVAECPTRELDTNRTCQQAGDNDGCAGPGYAANNVTLGSTSNPSVICGTLYSLEDSIFPENPADNTYTDFDYYQFTIASPQRLNWSVSASNGPVRTQIIAPGVNGAGCYDVDNPLPVYETIFAGACTAGETGELFLPAGTYAIVVSAATVDEGLISGLYECNNLISYSISASLTAATVGAQAYSAGAFEASTFTSIVGTSGATQVVLPGNGDESVALQTGLAPFDFYGETYTQAFISSNGLINFANDSTTFTPRDFPSSVGPNATIAPFWHDFDSAAPGAVGGYSGPAASIWIKTEGTLGEEVTTIEWNNVARSEDYKQRATFQVVLIRCSAAGNDGIEFRYGGTTNLALTGGPFPSSLDLADVGAGIEDRAGFVGIDLPADADFRTGNRTIRFSPINNPNCFAVAPVCCPGDADASGAVNFDDITSVLGNFGNSGPVGQNGDGDANCDGAVNFDDVTTVLGNFGTACN